MFQPTAILTTTQRWKANHQVSLLPKSSHRRLLRPTFLLVHRAIHWTTWYQYSEEVEEGCQCQPQHILGSVLLEGQGWGWVLDLVGCLCRLCRPKHRTQLCRQRRLHNSLRTIYWGCSRRLCVSFFSLTDCLLCFLFVVIPGVANLVALLRVDGVMFQVVGQFDWTRVKELGRSQLLNRLQHIDNQ